MDRFEQIIGRLNAHIERWGISFFIALFIFVVGILVVVWHYHSPEFAKFLGYLIGGGLLILQIFASNRRAAAAEETAKAMQKTAELTESGSIAERFKNAIEHLGNGFPSVRLGGAYALHHIAQEEEDYRKRVFEILCAHIRETTTHPEYRPRNAGSTEIKPTIEIQSILDLLFIGAQVQKIYKGLYVNLDGADLYGARFLSANLQQASLWDTNLQNAILVGVNLHGAYLVRAKLQNANLWDANLQGAHLVGANLQNADLNHVNLTDANLMDANLRNVDLTTARNLEVKQLLKAKTLYKADLPVGMKKEIEKEKPGLLDDPEAKQES